MYQRIVSKFYTVTYSAVIAGSCGGARALKMVIIPVCDKIRRQWPRVRQVLYVDDHQMQRDGG
eukprot:7757133-Pyramimonas_sp.AAC.1